MDNKLLEKLRTPRGFKPYRGLPLRYAGGKSRAVGQIAQYIPNGIESLVSPFFGAGAVEIALAKELGVKIQGYEVFDILVNYWQQQIANPEGLAKEIRSLGNTRADYNRVKEALRQHWEKIRLIESPISLAAHYWHNHNLSYGPGFLGWKSRIYDQELRVARLIEKVETFNCPSLSIDLRSFENSLPLHTNDFMYLDPPYFLGGDSTVFKGLYPQRNIPIHHKGFKHELLRDLLAKHKGGFILSYNDCSIIRDWYAGYDIKEVSWQYTMGQGETRIGKNREEQGADNKKKSKELLIIKRC